MTVDFLLQVGANTELKDGSGDKVTLDFQFLIMSLNLQLKQAIRLSTVLLFLVILRW